MEVVENGWDSRIQPLGGHTLRAEDGVTPAKTSFPSKNLFEHSLSDTLE
jgi:hypothetical protein